MIQIGEEIKPLPSMVFDDLPQDEYFEEEEIVKPQYQEIQVIPSEDEYFDDPDSLPNETKYIDIEKTEIFDDNFVLQVKDELDEVGEIELNIDLDDTIIMRPLDEINLVNIDEKQSGTNSVESSVEMTTSIENALDDEIEISVANDPLDEEYSLYETIEFTPILNFDNDVITDDENIYCNEDSDEEIELPKLKEE